VICKCGSTSASVHPRRQPTNRFAARGLRPQLARRDRRGASRDDSATGPGVQPDERSTPLVRHPRKPDAWGLDVQAFNAPGNYSFEFVINGPQRQGAGY
jgi:hypothetical protein